MGFDGFPRSLAGAAGHSPRPGDRGERRHEAQEAQAVNEAREANGRVEVAKILGGNRGTRGFPPWEIDEKTYGSHGISMEKRMEIRWKFDRKSMEPWGNSWKFDGKPLETLDSSGKLWKIPWKKRGFRQGIEIQLEDVWDFPPGKVWKSMEKYGKLEEFRGIYDEFMNYYVFK